MQIKKLTMLRLLFFLPAILLAGLSFAQTPLKSDSLNQGMSEFKVNIVSGDRSIEDILSELNVKYGFDFFYIEEEIPLQRKIYVVLNDVPLTTALQKIFENTGVSYFIVGKQIVLKVRPQKVLIRDSLKLVTLTPNNEVIDSTSGHDGSKPRTSPYYLISGSARIKEHGVSSKNGEKEWFTIKPADSTDFTSLKTDSSENASLKKINNSKYEGKAQGKVTLGFYGSPEFSYRRLSGSPESVIAFRDSIESGKRTFSFGLSLDYHLPYSFFIRTGLSCMSFKESGRYSVKERDPTIPQSGLPFPAGPGPVPYPYPRNYESDSVISYSTSYTYLSVPLSVGYRIGRRLNAAFAPALLLNFLLDYKTDYPSYGTPPNSPMDPFSRPSFNYYRAYLDPHSHSYRNFVLSLSLNMEVGYEINRTIRLFMAPSFKYFLSSIYNSPDGLKQRPYSFGISFGGSIMLRNSTRKHK
jgi:hypothetical protein